MTQGSEYRLAEKPCIDELQKIGYSYLKPKDHTKNRDGDNLVILKTDFIEAIKKINGIDEQTANDVYQDILRFSDNQEFTKVLRGDYSRIVAGEQTKRTIKLIDFKNTNCNLFTVTNQFYVKAQQSRKPDIVVFVNGIPLVVIEAKSPLSAKDKSGEAFEQIKQYEQDIPRLFFSNQFSIVTDGRKLLYGSTGSPSNFWGEWKDPHPKTLKDFKNDSLKMGLYALLEPSRLLDLLAHFIVFETRDGRTIKKICRYHQFRGVNKIVNRVVTGEHDRGLIWHTQGSGKSLSMVFTTLKLKAHLNLDSPNLENPNIIVLTDRVDLDDQISKTFAACGLPNPTRIDSISSLHTAIKSGTQGLTLLSTIFKFQGSKKPIEDSSNWIILVDECHRTQEKDLGACLRATFPEGKFFGFTGTPIKKSDKDTYKNFGAPDESYLDKYGIDDAVADGATVPIHYVSRAVSFNLDQKELDRAFDMTFIESTDKQLNDIKKRGVKVGELVKHSERVTEIAKDIWTHFQGFAAPDGLKAQIVAFDREAIILYKIALDKFIAKHLQKKKGLSLEEAEKIAETYSACVYSSNQEDAKPSEDKSTDELRKGLRKYYLDHDNEKLIKESFNKKGEAPYFLIVCNKLLTGFDAPIEGVMYLDNPLSEHNLLQAIARTNRVWSGGKKANGLIVDYIGVSKKLDDALSSYRSDDVKNAMRDVEELVTALKAAHNDVMAYLGEMNARDLLERSELLKLRDQIETIDRWFIFKRRVKQFVKAYEILSPDSRVLDYQADLKALVKSVVYLTPFFETKSSTDLQDVSGKIRDMLEEHLEVSGIATICKLRKITDPEFLEDFKIDEGDEKELHEAAIRKASELRKITEEKTEENQERYGQFSELVLAAIERYQKGQDTAADLLKKMEQVTSDLMKENAAHSSSGLDPKAHDIYVILKSFGEITPKLSVAKEPGNEAEAGQDEAQMSKLKKLAAEIHLIYQEASSMWQEKEQLRKELRGKVRRLAKDAGVNGWKKDLPARIEEYALKHFLEG